MFTLPTLALFFAPALQSGQVHVVDPLGYGDYSDIQAAVDAASEGDVILVRGLENPHLQPGFEIRAKSLTVRGIAGTSVGTGGITVRDLAPDQRVVLQDLDPLWSEYENWRENTVFVPRFTSETGLTVLDCLGSVRAERCRFAGAYDNCGPEGCRAVDIRTAQDVSLVDCEVLGGTSFAGSGRVGMGVLDSRVVLFGSTVRGGTGLYTEFFDTGTGHPGGTGLFVRGRSFVWCSDSTVLGGVGGEAGCVYSGCGSIGGPGGTGLDCEVTGVFYALETPVQGGAGGAGDGGFGAQGIDRIGGMKTIIGEGREMTAAGAILVGETVPASFRGSPGETVVVTVASGSAQRFLGWDRGVWLQADIEGPPITVGTVPPSGELVADVTLPPESTSAPRTLTLQARFVSGSNRFRLGPVRAVTILDASAPPFRGGGRIYVDAQAAPGGDGKSWAGAVATLEEGLQIAPAFEDVPTQIWMRYGEYLPQGDAYSSFVLRDGQHLHGGFRGTEFELSERVPFGPPTILTGDRLGNDQPDGTGRDDNRRNVVRTGSRLIFRFGDSGPGYGSKNVVLEGLTIRGAHREPTGTSSYWHADGGVWGVGDLHMERCLVTDNIGVDKAGGLTFRGYGSLTLMHCTFVANTGNQAAAVYAFRLRDGDLRASNCLFAGNECTTGAPAIYLSKQGPGQVLIENCTSYANRSSDFKSMVVFNHEGGTLIANSLFFADVNASSPGAALLAGINPAQGHSVRYSLGDGFPAEYPGWGNIEGDPDLVDGKGPDGAAGTLDDDLRLALGSPCIDAGDSTLVSPDLLLDLDYRPRKADEQGTPNTGAGGPRVVDMGVFER